MSEPSGRTKRLAQQFVWLSLSLALSCARCGEPSLAELKATRGMVERDAQKERETWRRANVGDAFVLGDGLRTGKDAEARLALFPAGEALVAANTVLRFLDEKPEDGVEVMEVVEGVVEIDSAAVEIELRTALGATRIAKRSRVRVRAQDGDDAMLDVIVGRVRVERTSTQGEVLLREAEAGETISLSNQEPTPEKQTGAAVDEKLAANEAPKSAKLAPADTAPQRAPDVRLSKLERATLHARTVPVSVAIDIPSCAEGASIAVTHARRTRSEATLPKSSRVVLELDVGTHVVVAKCAKRVLETGSLRVVRDAGTLELPRSPPRVELAADGRKYTVRYQNLLPTVTLHWPAAPQAGPFALRITKADHRTLKLSLSGPRAEIRSGELSEGEHQFVFSAGEKSSKPTRVRIVFDNTARVGYVTEPADGAPQSSTIEVAGGSLLNAQVSVDGKPLALDGRGRFHGSVAPPEEGSAIAVRMQHPSTGVHYYIRRLDRSPR